MLRWWWLLWGGVIQKSSKVDWRRRRGQRSPCGCWQQVLLNWLIAFAGRESEEKLTIVVHQFVIQLGHPAHVAKIGPSKVSQMLVITYTVKPILNGHARATS